MAISHYFIFLKEYGLQNYMAFRIQIIILKIEQYKGEVK